MPREPEGMAVMRDRLDQGYRALLRCAGLYGMIAVCGFFAGVPAQVAGGAQVVLPAIVAALGILVAAALLRPRLLPRGFAFPQRRGDLALVLTVNAALPLLFVLPCMGAVIALDVGEPLSRRLAILCAAVPFVLCGAAWWIGLLLCLTRPPQDTPGVEPRRIIPRRPRYPRLSPEQLADLRRQRGG